MADPTTSTPLPFVANTETREDMLKMLTVSLVHQREFNIHRAELEEQWDCKAAEKLQPIGGGSRGGGPAG